VRGNKFSENIKFWERGFFVKLQRMKSVFVFGVAADELLEVSNMEYGTESSVVPSRTVLRTV
jgi:hypothetical protein